MGRFHDRKVLLLTFFLCFTLALSAQKERLGINVGFGQTRISEDFKNSNYDDIKGDYWTAGATYYYSLGKSIVDLGGGVHFSYFGIDDMNLNYIKIPISADFHFGNVVGITAGGAVSADFLLASNVRESAYSTYEDTRESYQFGVFFRGGLTYKLNEKYWLKILYNYQYGNVPIFDTYRSGGHGPTSSTGMYDRGQYISLELNVKLG